MGFFFFSGVGHGFDLLTSTDVFFFLMCRTSLALEASVFFLFDCAKHFEMPVVVMYRSANASRLIDDG